ncbi:MAG: bifunctional (p)ppGpp synthetase/guanosine-3',5'-bis(diphosphate) 3'-pyrophosphohydrolase [Treponema sp.]|nr:bifunctional (p)ppGpp synthetase/guanosine-3',5'-bis(diphosphate) 3'-pyrophosphohydrolase [Treponema sp.]
MTEEEFVTNNEQTDSSLLLSEFFEIFPDYKKDQEKISSAWNFLLQKTQGMTRSCGKPYYLHPMRVAAILARNKLDADSIIGGFFHNLLPLPQVDIEEIRQGWGDAVATISQGTARITNLQISSKTLQQADSIRKMLFAMVDDVRVIMVKLADRLDRIRNLKGYDNKTQRAVAAEVIDIWAPLADRLGMKGEKNELEDLSLKYSNPDVFQQIKAIVSAKKDERSNYLDNAVQKITEAAKKANIEVSVKSRAKHFYSIYQKMRKRNKEVSELFDLFALRILCQTVPECYTLVGLAHSLWKPLDGRFKDYIAMPKANGYQSLHTTVLCEGKPLEIQIRTREMDNVAQHGVASHWLYKKGSSHDSVDLKGLPIFNQLRELREKHVDDESFFSEFKNDLLADEIVVFTPKGDVIQLPVGSCAIDFAYQIHSGIGEKIVGAKADGKIIPLSAPLQNTQIIEILTNPKSHPVEGWLKWTKTSKAKQKIRAWLTANDETFTDKGAVAKQAEANAQQAAANKVRQAHKKGTSPQAVAARHSGKVRVENSKNYMVTFAKCCNPKYPDPIAGYVSRTRGVTIHRANCYIFLRIPGLEKRMVDVSWEEE